jgi:uncharacterized protein YdhG (YjbR/CyaY superfamily)
MSAKKATKKTAKPTTTARKKSAGFSDFEKAAMKERAAELKAEANRAEGEKALLAKIAAMPQPDRGLAQGVHAIVTATAPHLAPKTWYGMPAYANGDGKVVCFFQSGAKYESRYCTLGFQDAAKLDAGSMWATAFALTKLTAANETKIRALVKKAAR